MDICRDVDDLMKDCIANNQEAFYYYWDCIFIPDGYSKHVIEYFKDLKYNVTTGKTKLEYIPVFKDGGGYLLSKADDKIYMVRKDSIGLLKQYHNGF